MKKLMCAIAAISAGVAMADVESANIVGYNTSPVVSKGKYLALGVTFESCEGSAIPVKQLFTYSEGAVWGSDAVGGADQIWRWDTQTAKWIKYFYLSANRGKVTRWVMDGDINAEDGYTRETTDSIPAGETFFFLRMGDDPAKLNLAGAVKPFDEKAAVVVSKGKLAFCSNPFPVSMNVKNFSDNYEVGTVWGSDAVGGADQIWRWDTQTAKWIKYFYLSANRGKVTRWVKDGDVNAEDGYTRETTDEIPAGEGFFFERMGDETVTIKLGMPSAE